MSDESFDDTTKEANANDKQSPQYDFTPFEVSGNERDDVEICRRALESICIVGDSQSSGSATFGSDDPVQRFEKIRFVGAGGFGIVFAAFDRTLEIDVAIKFLRPTRVSSVARKRFLEEAKITAGLTHPNIVRMYDSGMLGGIPFISSAYLDGGSLADLILNHPNGMDARDVADIGFQVAEAVAFAHAKATFHRDLKPSNVLIHKVTDQADRILATLTDFGLAKRWDREIENGYTLEGEVPGTVRYMSPEQAKGDLDEFSILSEVFSLGIILYEMATGTVPFDGVKNSDVRNQIVNHRPKNPSALVSTIAKDLESIILKCLEKEPSHRYDSVADLAKDLRRFLNREPVLASRPSQLRQAIWYAKTHPLTSTLVVSTFLVLLVSASLIGYAFWNQRIATAKEFKTKVDYIVLFGSLIDDVVAGKKEQQVALLDALSSFRKSLVTDLATNPNNSELQHLLSLIYHYESIVFQRTSSLSKLAESRIESVYILKALRYRHPENSKYRFQFLYGLVTLYVSLASADLDLPDQYELLTQRLDVASYRDLLGTIWSEMESFKVDFPNNKVQISACVQFKNDLVQLVYDGDPDKQRQLKDEVIAESISLAEQNPDSPDFIKPALTAVNQRLSKSLAERNYSEAIVQMDRSEKLFDKYMRPNLKTLWIKVFYLEMKTWHADCLVAARDLDRLRSTCLECLALADDLNAMPEYRLICANCRLKFETILLLFDKTDATEGEQAERLKRILFLVESPETPSGALAMFTSWRRSFDLPEEISKALDGQLAIRKIAK